VPISLTQYTHWPALGAAILAGVGAGVFETLDAGVARFQKSPREIMPDDSHQQLYGEQFVKYKKIVQRLSEV
jgi:sugar (pentulose or hexulose) kinase